MSLSEERMRMLTDGRSTYFRQIDKILRDQIVSNEKVENSRETMVLPMVVSPEDRAKLSRIFRWKIDVKDYGILFRGVPFVAAMVFLMGLRNVMLMGSDGEEAIFIDGDLAALTAKGLTYGHVCRTNATARLQASYALEDEQVVKLCSFANARTSSAAKALRAAQVKGDVTRVCEDAAHCTRSADTVFFNHAVTPVSLAQAVATAKAHGANVVRGVAFFQPEMLTEVSGPMQAFPGTFVVDRHNDVITFVPEGDSSMGISHPYSSLLSFFLNHEYVSGSDRWLIEKHLSGDGIYHYILRRELMDVSFPETLSANYYRHEMTKWVELEYTSYMDEDGALLRVPKRMKTRLLEACYEKTMSVLMYIDVKQLTQAKVFALLKSHNNSVVCFGDTVRKPERVWYDSLRRAAVPVFALALARRAAVSKDLAAALDSVKQRFKLRDASAASLFWSAVVAGIKSVGEMALGTLSGHDIASLEGIVSGTVDMSVVVTRSTDRVEVRHMSGEDNGFKCGRMEQWLPAPAGRNLSLLARARAWVSKADVSVGSSDSSRYDKEVTFVDGNGAHGGCLDVPLPVEVTEIEDISKAPLTLEGKRKQLFDSLVARQDALSVKPPVRMVERYVGPERDDVVVVPPLDTDPIAVAQAEYDSLLPGVSESDEEMKPVIASQCDVEKRVNFNGVINDSKREVAPPRWVRRSRLRTGGAGKLPPVQVALWNAMCKRNTDVPNNRGFVDLEKTPGVVVQSMIDACYVDNWREKLVEELDAGLWQSVADDIHEYVPKVAPHIMERMVNEYVTADDENLYRWLLMLKSQGKPPMDPRAHEKVQLPQTIMYSDQKVVNAKYSAIQTRFYRVMKSLLRGNVSFNNRDSPAEHEIWFNSCQGIRNSAANIYSLAGDITCYDRSQEHLAQLVEARWYQVHGLNKETLHKWSETHGVKKATSMMYGIIIFVFLQGLSGIWKTLFRNGLVCLGAVVHCAQLRREDIVTLDVVGDDFLVELLRPVEMRVAIDKYTLTFNLTAKLTQPAVLEICSKLWVRVNGWWYFVQNPMRKIESVSNAIACGGGDERLEERWVSLRDDLRHYDNAIVMEALAESVKRMYKFPIAPVGIISALGTLAADKSAFMNSFGPEELLI